jgi:SAM-dependent methyltransferase
MPWYADWFDRPEYERVYQQRDTEEAERAANLIERFAEPAPSARLLDVGCGRGRHARAFARRGYRVTGIDLSEKAIQAARRRADEEDLAIDFRRQDMREPMGTGAFDGAVNLFSSFGYFDHDEEHQQVIQHVAEALRPSSGPGGFFVQDFMNADQVRASLVPESTRTEDGLQIDERRWIEDGRINKEITLRPGGDGARSEAPSTFRESVRLLELDDFRRFYERAGLRLESTFGDYDGTPYGEHSPRLIMVSRKSGR